MTSTASSTSMPRWSATTSRAVLDVTGVPAARSVVDLGAGTGAGSRLLRERYPDAAVTCVDNDRQMLELLR